MAVISSSKIVFYVMGCLCLAAIVASRPQNTIDSQDTPDQDSSNEIKRLYTAYNNYPGSNGNGISPEERMALNRLQYEMMANYVQNNMPTGGWSDPIYRSPEIKRQVRYRQCYFNPISCFRK